MTILRYKGQQDADDMRSDRTPTPQAPHKEPYQFIGKIQGLIHLSSVNYSWSGTEQEMHQQFSTEHAPD